MRLRPASAFLLPLSLLPKLRNNFCASNTVASGTSVLVGVALTTAVDCSNRTTTPTTRAIGAIFSDIFGALEHEIYTALLEECFDRGYGRAVDILRRFCADLPYRFSLLRAFGSSSLIDGRLCRSKTTTGVIIVFCTE